MSKLKCKCDFVISTNVVPNKIEYWVFSDEEWMENQLRNEDHKDLLDPIFDVWVCPNCKRIHVFKMGDSKPYRIYRLEE